MYRYIENYLKIFIYVIYLNLKKQPKKQIDSKINLFFCLLWRLFLCGQNYITIIITSLLIIIFSIIVKKNHIY